MIENMRVVAKNVSYTFISNIVGLFISTVLVLIVPKFISVENYGLWQLYIFYSSYTSYLSLGMTDGVYLKIAGSSYGDLNKNEMKSQYRVILTFNLLILTIFGISLCIVDRYNIKNLILFFSFFSACIIVPRSLFTFILQATNRIKEYAITILLERVIYFILIILFLVLGVRSVPILICTDLIGKALSYIYTMYLCKDILHSRSVGLKATMLLTKENISIGSKLLIANLSSMLIIGVLRFSIERVWDIATFGKVSLTLSISNMLMIFINSVGIVILPVIKNYDPQKLVKTYKSLRVLLSSALYFILLVYFPANVLISYLLPNYADSVKFVALLFPMCVFEGKMAMLINTYMKALRFEAKLMVFNLYSVMLSFLLALVFAFGLKNLNMTVLSIVLSIMFKAIIAERFLSKEMKIRLDKYILLDILVTFYFIFLAWIFTNVVGFLLYLVMLVIYLIMNKKTIISSAFFFKGREIRNDK